MFKLGGFPDCFVQAWPWIDNRGVGIWGTEEVGSPDGHSTTRQLRGVGETPIDSFAMQVTHGDKHGAVDRVGRDAAEFGADFQHAPWHNRLAKAAMNISNFGIHALAQHQLDVDPGDPLLAQYKKGLMGMARRKQLLLGMTRGVIERAAEHIAATGEWGPGPNDKARAK